MCHDAIMIPHKSCTWDTSFRLRGACDWPLNSHIYWYFIAMLFTKENFSFSFFTFDFWHLSSTPQSIGTCLLSFYKLVLIDNVLLEHVVLPLVPDLTVHRVNFFGWMSKGTFLLLALFYQSTPLCLKVRGRWGGWVAHVILVSALGQNPFFFLFLGTFI